MPILPRSYPKGFRADVVAVARRGQTPIAQVAKDFGTAESCLRNWLHAAEVEDGNRSGRARPSRSRSPTLRCNPRRI
jgi:transposase-like protein